MFIDESPSRYRHTLSGRLFAIALALTGLPFPSATSAQDAHRGLSIAGPSFFAVSVADLDSSEAWYRRILGMTPLRSVDGQTGTSRVVVMQRSQLTVELIAFDGSQSPAAVSGAAGHSYAIQGLVKAGIFVTNIDDWHNRLATLGIEADPHVVTDSALGARTFVFQDRDGNRIQVFQMCAGACSSDW